MVKYILYSHDTRVYDFLVPCLSCGGKVGYPLYLKFLSGLPAGYGSLDPHIFVFVCGECGDIYHVPAKTKIPPNCFYCFDHNHNLEFGSDVRGLLVYPEFFIHKFVFFCIECLRGIVKDPISFNESENYSGLSYRVVHHEGLFGGVYGLTVEKEYFGKYGFNFDLQWLTGHEHQFRYRFYFDQDYRFIMGEERNGWCCICFRRAHTIVSAKFARLHLHPNKYNVFQYQVDEMLDESYIYQIQALCMGCIDRIYEYLRTWRRAIKEAL